MRCRKHAKKTSRAKAERSQIVLRPLRHKRISALAPQGELNGRLQVIPLRRLCAVAAQPFRLVVG